MTHVRALWVLGTLLVGCSSYEPNGVVFVGGESCPAPQFDSLDDAGVEGRSALEALQWIEEHWASRQVAWRGGGRATVEVAVTVPDDAEFYMLDEADCDLLLDVNNIYVNSINHKYNAEEFLAAMPADRIMYIHVAGHYNEAEDLIVDTHGADIVDPVWALLEKTYAHFGAVPTLLERDFNIPPIQQLALEVDRIRQMQQLGGAHERTVA